MALIHKFKQGENYFVLDVNSGAVHIVDELVFDILEDVGLQTSCLELYPHQFSGGQRQKVAIARALYTDGDFVIMDEASSALDPIAENEINQLIINTMKNKTILIITHRLSTVKHVDKIYFMENGQIVESGTHDELMDLKGKYAEMYSVQAKQYSHV